MNREKPVFIMVGNSHIDPVWLWLEEEGLQEVKATFASALARMEEFPEFEFTASSAALYDWVRRHHKGLFRDIRRRVKEGRWHLSGGWWIEPDLNASNGESLVRQGLYGQRFFRKHFGKAALVSFNVDSFGHTAGLPAILTGQGLRAYVFMRPNPHQKDLAGTLMKWRDAGGQEVLACRISGEYCAWTKTAIKSNLDLAIQDLQAQSLPLLPVYYGVGNHGGGPTIENIKAVRELKEEYPACTLKQGGLEDCLSAWEGLDLPVHTGELQGVFPGCYSADSQLKALNRRAESELVAAETLCALALPLGFAYPKKPLEKAWKTLLFQQFHDTLAGTARKEARDQAETHLQGVRSTALSASQSAIQALARAVDTRGDGQALLLFNPNGADYEGLVEADLYWRSKFALRLKEPGGQEIPYDETTRGLVAPEARKRLVFHARVPAFGYAVYRLMPEKPVSAFPLMNHSPEGFENQHLAVSLDQEKGLAGILDKKTGRQLLAGPVELAVYQDLRDTWGGQGQAGPLLGRYRVDKAILEEAGSARCAIRLDCSFSKSRASLSVMLGKEDSFLSISGAVNQQEALALTALRLPLAFEPAETLAEAPYSEILRPVVPSQEETCQRYLEARGTEDALLVVNKGQYAYRVHEGALEIILGRSPVHAFSAGETLQEGRHYAYCDQGSLPLDLRLYPDSGKFGLAERAGLADALNRPIRLLACDSHEGPLAARSGSLARAEGALVHQFKQGEEGGILARVQNPLEAETPCKVVFHQREAAFSLAPRALQSLLFREGKQPALANLLEDLPEKEKT